MMLCFFKKELGQSLIKKPKAQVRANMKETPHFNFDIDLIYQEKIKSRYSKHHKVSEKNLGTKSHATLVGANGKWHLLCGNVLESLNILCSQH